MQKHKQPVDLVHELSGARYAMLRTYRRDGAAVDTPIWFDLQGSSLVFRTKVGPKTKRMTAHSEVEITACDYRGRIIRGAGTFTGRATILSGHEATEANRALHRRYGWQWNTVPLVKLPGVTNVHSELSVREKLRRARDRNVWPDSAIVRIDFDGRASDGGGPDTSQ
ncbi:PPOX class F420-dependent enzyme [Mycobacterium sp. ACS1612]|uniref:PPOX class F420-dependent oxidoreductase n=1 Tax=Mycobacterium sp. ACS1612 TaxID=1834117 RepID=UPI0007FFD567|nr:PPOX class F420-dependent oxidoreductase [Mycobacterium sp. ACS1612]OBF33707.1 PPOX class F420-dependent enzyme [Mycobacterium sp. ACS1612]